MDKTPNGKKRNIADMNPDSIVTMIMGSSFAAARKPSTTSRCVVDDEELLIASVNGAYQNLSLTQMLDECMFDFDDQSIFTSVTPIPRPHTSDRGVGMVYHQPPKNKNDLIEQLEDFAFLTHMASPDDIPVAAALVSILEDPNKSPRAPKRTCITDDTGRPKEACSDDMRFRAYQSQQWYQKFEELVLFRKVHGHCLVPHTYVQNLPLARWVKRQRYQYKLMKDGHPKTSMTEERAKMLEDIDFVWSSQAEAWSERLEELREYLLYFGDCNVPSNYAANPKLATWVKCQRRQYKLFREQKPANITLERIKILDGLGFEWELRSPKQGGSS